MTLLEYLAVGFEIGLAVGICIMVIAAFAIFVTLIYKLVSSLIFGKEEYEDTETVMYSDSNYDDDLK